jgi:hypothetical protein
VYKERLFGGRPIMNRSGWNTLITLSCDAHHRAHVITVGNFIQCAANAAIHKKRITPSGKGERTMNRRILLVVSAIVLMTGVCLAQMRGGSASGGMSGSTSGTGMGQGSMGGMHGSSGMGSMDQSGPMMTQGQRRQLMHTTAMQDQKYQASARAMGKVQGDLSQMQLHMNGGSSSRGTSSSAASPDGQQQGNSPSTDLSSDLQDLEQSNDDLASSLNSDQQAVVASKLKDLNKKTKEMQTLAEQLKSEMGNPQADPKVVREHMKKLDKLGKEIAKQQREVASALGINA